MMGPAAVLERDFAAAEAAEEEARVRLLQVDGGEGFEISGAHAMRNLSCVGGGLLMLAAAVSLFDVSLFAK